MKHKNNQQEPHLTPKMIEDKATEKLKKHAQDLGLIVNAGASERTKPTGKKKPSKR